MKKQLVKATVLLALALPYSQAAFSQNTSCKQFTDNQWVNSSAWGQNLQKDGGDIIITKANSGYVQVMYGNGRTNISAKVNCTQTGSSVKVQLSISGNRWAPGSELYLMSADGNTFKVLANSKLSSPGWHDQNDPNVPVQGVFTKSTSK